MFSHKCRAFCVITFAVNLLNVIKDFSLTLIVECTTWSCHVWTCHWWPNIKAVTPVATRRSSAGTWSPSCRGSDTRFGLISTPVEVYSLPQYIFDIIAKAVSVTFYLPMLAMLYLTLPMYNTTLKLIVHALTIEFLWNYRTSGLLIFKLNTCKMKCMSL